MSFRKTSLDLLGIDCSQFLTVTSLSLQTFLKDSGCEIPLLTDGELYQMFKRGIRVGCVSATKSMLKPLILMLV